MVNADMLWPLYAIAEAISVIIAYITNPIVVLFADEYGNLPNCLRWWGTFDNTLDVRWMITENKVPKIFQYDYDKHYIYHYEDKGNGYVIPGHVEIVNSNFTTKEKIQRYFCRLAWLYRNTAYGFSYYVLGKRIFPRNILVVRNYNYGEYDNCTETLDASTGFINRVWKLHYYKQWCKYFYLRVYIGWKITSDTKTNPNESDVAMLACYIWPFRLVKNK